MAYNSGSPPEIIIRSSIEPLKTALSHVRDTHTEQKETLTRRARNELENVFGLSKCETHIGFAYGVVGLLAQHTRYFDGFAVVLKIPEAVAVAVRPVKTPGIRISVCFESKEEPSRIKEKELWVRTIELLALRYVSKGSGVEIAVANSMPPGCADGGMASLVVAVEDALKKLPEVQQPDDYLAFGLEALDEADNPECCLALLLAAATPQSNAFIVIDTETREVIPFEGPPPNQVCWGIVDGGRETGNTHFEEISKRVVRALESIRVDSKPHVSSFRDIAHIDLSRLLNSLPRRYRPTLRHLLTENKRVYSLIKAIRRKDWQMVGGLLYISHASLKSDWHGIDEQADHVVEEVKKLSSEGMYGACMTGWNGRVLVVGQPLVISLALKRIQTSFKERFKKDCRVWIL